MEVISKFCSKEGAIDKGYEVLVHIYIYIYIFYSELTLEQKIHTGTKSVIIYLSKVKLYHCSMQAPRGRGGIAPTHFRPR